MSEIPWWGWLIIAVIGLCVVYLGIFLLFFRKVSKRVFRTFDDVHTEVLGHNWTHSYKQDPFNGKSPYTGEALPEQVKRMTARKPWPPE